MNETGSLANWLPLRGRVRFDLAVPVARTVGVVSVVFGCGGSSVFAGDVGQMRFDIPAQSLTMALRAFAGATGAFGIYDGKLVADRQSAGLKGEFRPDAALAVLLEGTGLVAEYTAHDAFIVVAPSESATLQRSAEIALAALSSQSDPERRYSALLQHSLEGRLCSEPLTRPGSYRAAISVTIDARGTVQRLKLLSSTGDRQRDAAIVAVGSRTSVGAPPPSGMRQPFAMVILPRQSGAVLQCDATLGRD